MRKPKLSPWISGRIKPALVGVYERAVADTFSGRYSYFDGKRWGVSHYTPALAERNKSISSTWQNLKWRGLAESASNENGQRGSEA
jgi:hypothetical protein